VTGRDEEGLELVPVAEFRYRHEAEFAAGLLADAGLPFRLQVDDAGGDLGLTLGRLAVLWVRAADEERAREVLDTGSGTALEEE
jgi:hypothetical protein